MESLPLHASIFVLNKLLEISKQFHFDRETNEYDQVSWGPFSFYVIAHRSLHSRLASTLASSL